MKNEQPFGHSVIWQSIQRWWIVVLIFSADVAVAQQSGDKTVGYGVSRFTLHDTEGQSWSLEDCRSRFVVVAFLGTECPIVRLYADRLNELSREFAKESVTFVGINSNQHDSLKEMRQFVREHSLAFPVLKDIGNRIADTFQAQRTPEVFVLDRQRRVVYRGAIDDQYQYGVQRSKATEHYLKDALSALVAGQPLQRPVTTVMGCVIGRVLSEASATSVTYCKQISRILQEHCVRCHREGDIAPFALVDYDEVVGWAGMIEEVVREQRMPPWHVDAEPGYLKNDARLSESDKQLIYDWVQAGAPQGDPGDLPPALPVSTGWRIGTPDMVIAMADQPYEVPAHGAVAYQYFQVDPGFEEDKWIRAAECRPGNRAVVHHIIVGIAGEGEFRHRRVHGELDSEWIAATAPGASPMQLPPGYAKFAPAGSKLIFQMHYTPNGTAQSDLSEIGLIFANPSDVDKRVVTMMAANTRFKIPPHADNYQVTANRSLSQDVELLTLFPHMHYRGKSFEYSLRFPDGGEETLLNVPRYDFNWQNAYELSQSRMLPKGTAIHCVAHFDNSANNLANPDPDVSVSWGDQTWDEMMIGYFDVAVPVSVSDATTIAR